MVMAELPLPSHYHPERITDPTPTPYAERAAQAARFAQAHAIDPARHDRLRTCLLLVDVQNTFCTPGFELVVEGAVGDNRRLCEFIYRNLAAITTVVSTLDTHSPFQIFHPLVWIDAQGQHPTPGTIISPEDTEVGRWRIDPRLAEMVVATGAQRLDDAYARYYTQKLAERGRYPLTVWPLHGLVGSRGHAVVPAVEEAVYFHSVAREAPAYFLLKGESPLTEHYSVFGPEVNEDPQGRPIGSRHYELLRQILAYDRIIVAGQAKSHCVVWTLDHMLEVAASVDPRLAERIYVLEDCTSPVVIPGVHDFTEEANAALARFEAAGIHSVRSTVPLSDWPGSRS
jgi:nicotinamidase-related amidase